MVDLCPHRQTHRTQTPKTGDDDGRWQVEHKAQLSGNTTDRAGMLGGGLTEFGAADSR